MVKLNASANEVPRGMKDDYSIECQCNGMHIDYCKRYTLKES